MGLHILLHVVECLVLPAMLVGLSGHAAEESAMATESSVMTEITGDEEYPREDWSHCGLVDFQQSLCLYDFTSEDSSRIRVRV